jgi:CheY-like chemotaxis protein
MTPASIHPRLLVVEDDPDIHETLQLLLEVEGYDLYVAPSLETALALLDAQSFHGILTDLFANGGGDPLALAEILRQRAAPTPIVVVTAWMVPVEWVKQRGFAGLVSKPFQVEDLLTTVATCLATPLSPEQERQAQVVRAYFAALTANDWDSLLALCTDDLTYVLPGNTSLSGMIEGQAAFCAYTEDTYHHFADAQFDEVHNYARPYGLAARFHSRWHAAEGSEQQQTGSVVFRFAGERIAYIGVEIHTERLKELVWLMYARMPTEPETLT